MAEAAGLAVGIVSLLNIFDSCIGLAERIHDARTLGKDYEARIVMLWTLDRRLKNCRAKMNDGGSTIRIQINEDSRLQQGLGQLLALIQSHLSDVDKLLNKYNPEVAQNCLVQIDSSNIQLYSLEEAAEHQAANSARRQQKVSSFRKITWAVSDRKALVSTTEQIEQCVYSLEKLSEGVPPAMTFSPSSSSGLEDVAHPSIAAECNVSEDTTVAGVCVQSSVVGHTYHHNLIRGQSRVTQGDVGPDVPSEARSHTYVGNEITGNARVIQGNTSCMDMRSFWDD